MNIYTVTVLIEGSRTFEVAASSKDEAVASYEENGKLIDETLEWVEIEEVEEKEKVN
jgi:hypothetical protein